MKRLSTFALTASLLAPAGATAQMAMTDPGNLAQNIRRLKRGARAPGYRRAPMPPEPPRCGPAKPDPSLANNRTSTGERA